MVKLKLSLVRPRTRFFMKKKDKIAGGRNNTNDFNGGGDGEKKKEKDPSKVQQIMKTFDETEIRKIVEEQMVIVKEDCIRKMIKSYEESLKLLLEKMNGDGGGDDDNNGDGGGDDDNNGGGGGKNNKKGRDGDGDGDGDGNGDKYKSDHDSDGGGKMKGKTMDFMGKAGFGYRFGYHAGNENGYQVEQLQCAQEVQTSEPKCLFYHAIMIS